MIRKLNNETTYIRDLIEAFLLAATSKKAVGEIFNIGGKSVRFIDMAKTVIEVVSKGSLKQVSWPDDYWIIETGYYFSNTTKDREILGLSPKTPLKEGIRLTIEAFKDDRSILRRLHRL